MSQMPWGLTCDECGAILRELREAVQLDQQELRQRLRQTADSSGRSVEEMGDVWLSSIINLPSDEIQTIMRAQYPRIVDVRRRQADHESRTGHSVFRDGWRAMKMPHEDLLTIMRTLWAIR
jgi:hypothetical protein